MSANNSRSRDSTGGIPPKKKECYVFEPQQWRRSVCKNCFRSLHDHPTEPPSTATASGNGKGLSPRTSPLLGTKALSGSSAPSGTGNKEPVVLRKTETSPTSRRRPKSDEFKQKTPSPRQSQRTLTSSGRRSPGSSPSASSSRHSGSFTAQNRQSSTSSIDTKYVEELENDFFDLEDKYDSLSKDKFELDAEITDKNRTIEELQEDIESYKIKIQQLERRVQHLDEEIRGYRERLRLPESDQANAESNTGMGSQNEEILAENEHLRQRLEEIEQLCQEVMEENELLKEEQEEMQKEIEEMHDHFQEDDTDTLRELKRDLETSNKNSRIFQFKLRKTERRYEQCENERVAIEDKLNRLESLLYSENDVGMIRGLEEELRVAKEVSVRLNSELELVDEKRSYFEEDNKHLKEDLQDSEKRRKTLEGELSKCRQEIEKLKSVDSGGFLIPDMHSAKKTKLLESLTREPSFEEQSLQRELDAARERETDLCEQLKFAEDEIRKVKRRLNDAEEENDSLSKKLESVMNNTNIDDNDYEDLSIHTLKTQMELLEQENSTLRKKFLLMEKENVNLINDMRNMKEKTCKGIESNKDQSEDKFEELSKKITDLNAEIKRLEFENNRLCSSTTTQRIQAGSATISQPLQYHIDMESMLNLQNNEIKTENIKMKDKIKQYDEQIKNIINEMDHRFGSQDDDQKHLDMLLQYNEVTSSFRDQQKEIIQIRRQMQTMNEENEKYKEFYDKNSRPEGRKRNDTKSGLENASKAVLMEEIGCLGEEIDELSTKFANAEIRMVNLTKNISAKESIIEEMEADTERNEKELNQYIQNILTKNSLLRDLLTCVELRANDLQAQFDRNYSFGISGESSSSSSTTTTTEIAVGESKISDNVFDETSIVKSINLNDIEKIKFQFSCLERLLSEERKRTRIAEKQVEIASKNGNFSRQDEKSQLKRKENEMLKRDLEEKNEILEEKEQNLQDMRSRLEQTRKMNEALRTLLDKQDDNSTGSPSQKSRDIKDKSIEINSYRKEISAMKAELHQYVIKLGESEKNREKLSKEIRNLQAEIKVREEQIYEQDDEMRAKDQEIRTIKKLLEETQNQTQANDRSEEINERDHQIKMLLIELDHVRKSLQNYKSHGEELEIELKQNESQQKHLSDSVRARDERIKEKDDHISHLNQRLQHRERELTDFDSIIKETNEKLNQNEELIKETQIALSKKEIEVSHLKAKNVELQTSHDNIGGHLRSVEKENEKFKSRMSDLEKERSKPVITPRVSTPLAPDVDKLRSEVAQLKKDKESLIEKINRSQGTFSAMKKDSDTAKSDSEAYTRAIQQQQYVTRVSLLTDNVTRLNRANIELKLHNEAIQNDMLEYQRRYKNIKEQYEAEEETWAAEKITIESRMKEFEDRKSVIVSVRKSLQDASLKVANLEVQLTREKQEHELKLSDFERERSDLQKKLSQYVEKEKLPKVFQRFGGKMTSRTANDIVLDKEKTELKVKLEAADKIIQKLRLEIVDKEERNCKVKTELLNKSEETRLHLEGLIQDMSNKLAEMEGLKEQMFVIKERIFTLEESQDRDRKIWNEERMIFQFKLEDTRITVENWFDRLKDSEHSGVDRTVTVDGIEKEMEKYLYSKECIPYAQMCRRIQSQQESVVLSGHSNQTNSIFGKPPMKSASLDWTNRPMKSPVPQDLSNSNQSINVTSFSRSNRSVSPDQSKHSLTTKKITNYPDPTPGFMVRSLSRQSSIESVSRDTDYTQRSSTLPGMRNIHNASRISPARQRFFETTSSIEHLTCPISTDQSVPVELKATPCDGNIIVDRRETEVQDIHTVPHDETPLLQHIAEPLLPKADVKVPDIHIVPHDETTHLQQIAEPLLPKADVKVTFSQPSKTSNQSENVNPAEEVTYIRQCKPKSTSIAPSIQQLRMKFAQKSANSDSSLSKK